MCNLLPFLALVFAIMHLYNFLIKNNKIKKFLCSPLYIFLYLVSINETEWSTIVACPSLMCSFNSLGNSGKKKLCNSSKKLCLMFVFSVRFFNVCVGIVFAN